MSHIRIPGSRLQGEKHATRTPFTLFHCSAQTVCSVPYSALPACFQKRRRQGEKERKKKERNPIRSVKKRHLKIFYILKVTVNWLGKNINYHINKLSHRYGSTPRPPKKSNIQSNSLFKYLLKVMVFSRILPAPRANRGKRNLIWRGTGLWGTGTPFRTGVSSSSVMGLT